MCTPYYIPYHISPYSSQNLYSVLHIISCNIISEYIHITYLHLYHMLYHFPYQLFPVKLYHKYLIYIYIIYDMFLYYSNMHIRYIYIYIYPIYLILFLYIYNIYLICVPYIIYPSSGGQAPGISERTVTPSPTSSLESPGSPGKGRAGGDLPTFQNGLMVV